MAKALNTVTDRFSLFNAGRKFSGNGRNYVIESVQKVIGSNRFQEDLKNGEHFGYWGHQRRAMAKKLRPSEHDVIMMEGKPVVLNSAPSNVMTAISCSDDGIVEHTQDILHTADGKIVNAMLESNRGGWSWATSGSDGVVSMVEDLAGIDYVKQPNFISLNKQDMMESSTDDVLDRLSQIGGVDKEAAQLMLEAWDRQGIFELQGRADDLQYQVMMLEGVLAEKALEIGSLSAAKNELEQLKQDQLEQSKVMLESINGLPIILASDFEQKLLANPSQSARLMFEAIDAHFKQKQLPHTNDGRIGFVNAPKKKGDNEGQPVVVNVGSPVNPFKKS